MDFLKDILGDDLFKQVQEKIDAHNESAETKVKIADLGSGQYVSKDKYASKESELASKVQELLEANNLIGDLKKGTKDNETLQGKITDYETQIELLQDEIQEARLKAAIKVALMSEKAQDVDYLTFKLNEKLAESGEKLELDDNDNIKGWKDKIEGLKIQFPSQFESSKQKKIEEHKLEKPDDNDSGTKVTKEEFNKMGYKSRVELRESDPELYNQLAN